MKGGVGCSKKTKVGVKRTRKMERKEEGGQNKVMNKERN